MSCDCLATSTCSSNTLRLPEEGDVLCGYVKVTFNRGDGQTITVGNESAPGLKNHACIKDFEFGHSDGCEARISVHDEQGGSFTAFMNNILSDLTDADVDNASTMVIDFGWIKTFCNGTTSIMPSQKYYLMARSVDCNFAGGKFMFNITGVDITEVAFETKVSKIYGSESQKIHITEAIKQLFTDESEPKSYPIVKQVDFLKRPKSGQVPQQIEWDVYDRDPKKGPKGTGCWKANTKNKFEVAKEWLSEFVSKDNKAIIPSYDSTVPGGRIIFWEDPKPGCARTDSVDLLGTYVVNGGVHSNVLEFNPKIKWYFAGLSLPGGSVGDNQPLANKDGGKNQGLKDCFSLQRTKISGGGSMTSSAPSDNGKEMHGKKAGEKADNARALQQRAYDIFIESIEAEMVVMGDPSLMRPQECLFRNVQIIFVNPLYIIEDQDSCGDWLATPACHPILSNKNWMIKSITHRIQDGKFTTTFQLYLAAPGVDINSGEPIGGSGSGGPTL